MGLAPSRAGRQRARAAFGHLQPRGTSGREGKKHFPTHPDFFFCPPVKKWEQKSKIHPSAKSTTGLYYMNYY